MKSSVYVIAEAGVNHNGSMELALKLIDCAAEAGADAVKFQTFKAKNLVSKKAKKADYQIETTGAKESQFEMIQKLELSDEDHRTLVDHAKKKGIDFLSTPFDEESADLLIEKFNLPMLKVSSGDLTHAPLLLKLARSGKPVIISTGMATLADVELALGVLAHGYLTAGKSTAPESAETFRDAFLSHAGQQALQSKVTVLHCTTEYPAPFDETNLRAMETLKQAFGLPVGFSDHTQGIAIPIAAVALGAQVIEKHFTLDRKFPGPDHRASLEPEELVDMVRSIRQVEKSLGSALKAPAPSELKNRLIARRSLVASRTIQAGEVFSAENLTVKRPGNGMAPVRYWELLGKSASRSYEADELIGEI